MFQYSKSQVSEAVKLMVRVRQSMKREVDLSNSQQQTEIWSP